MITKLKVYATPDHPHAAQKPQPLTVEASRDEVIMATDTRTYATGKRKTAIARIWLKPGTRHHHRQRQARRRVLRARDLAHDHAPGARAASRRIDQFDVCGHGASAAATPPRPRPCATASRAPSACSTPRSAPSLKRAGFLTRDARKKERKKYGQPGARKRFQYSQALDLASERLRFAKSHPWGRGFVMLRRSLIAVLVGAAATAAVASTSRASIVERVVAVVGERPVFWTGSCTGRSPRASRSACRPATPTSSACRNRRCTRSCSRR